MAISGPLKYHGGKSYLDSWIHSLAPAKGTYTTRVIGCAGGLGEMWDWEHDGIAEVVNDINLGVTNFWRVLQQESTFQEFKRLVEAIPLSQFEWKDANSKYDPYHDPFPPELMPHVGYAAQFFVKYRQSRQGLGRSFATMTKRRTRRGMNEQASAWLSAVEGLADAHKRLSRVVVMYEDVIRLILQLDDPQTLFYLDPPYLHEERTATDCYEYEMTWEDHDKLCMTCANMQGKFMLSGYRSELYDNWALAMGWYRFERVIDNKSSSSAVKEKKIECIYTNYLPAAA